MKAKLGRFCVSVQDGDDDAFFHRNVIPSMKCDQCGKTAGDDYRPLATKYDEGQVI